MDQISALKTSFFEALRPPAKLSLSEWADKNAVLSAESSAEAGPWHTIPYQKGIMDAFTDPKITEIWVKKSARVGWTKILNHVVGYHIDQDPCSIMLVQPTIEDAEGHSKEELAPMFRDTPCLQGKVADAKAKDGTNTILQKLYPGGTLGLVGANSPRGFRRVSRRLCLFDEIDGYPPSAGTEGDQIKLGIKRTEYYWNRKIAGGSTPTDEATSRIERIFQTTDQRYYEVPCTQCGHMDRLVFRENRERNEGKQVGHFMKWPNGEPEKAYFVCSLNGCVIEHSKKRWMVENGHWRATAKSSDARRVGFHIWAAYSYSPNASWGQLASEFIEAKADRETLKTFINTVLGEVFEDEYTAKLGAEGLQGRAEFYETDVVPARACILTAGIDVQDNRLEATIYAWAPGEESWVLSHNVVFGDPAKAEIWKQIDNIIMKPFRREDGKELTLAAAAIDTGGHFTHEVYQYARERKRGGVIPVKGQSQPNKPAIGQPTRVDLNIRGQKLKGGAEVYPMGSDTIKAVIYGRLKMTAPGPGYYHFPMGLDEEFYRQLTAERRVVKYNKRGFNVFEWVKKSGARNEVLDCAVMAYAALQWLYTRYRRATIFAQFEEKLNGKPVVEEPETVAAKALEEPQNDLENKNRQRQAVRTNIRPRSRGGFMGRY